MKWKRELLEEACTFISRGISPKYTEEGGVLVINQKCVRNHTIDYSLARRHDIEKKNVKPERFIQRGDILINSTGQGTLGRVAQVRDEPPEPTTVDSHVTIVRPNPKKFYLDYFGYALIQIEDELKNSGQGTSGQTELAKTRVQKEFFASYPSDMSEQQRIVAKLDAVFAEIDEAINTAAAKENEVQKLKASLLSSFFRDNTVMWRETTLGEYYDVRDGTHDSPKYIQDGYPLVTSKNLKNGKVDLTKVKYISKEDYENINKRSEVSIGDVLMAMIGTIGSPVEIIESPKFAIKNVALFKTNEEQSPAFLFYFLSHPHTIAKMMADAKGTTQKFVGLGYLRSFPILVPKLEVQEQIVKKLRSVFAELENINDSIFRIKTNYHALKSATLKKELQASDAA